MMEWSSCPTPLARFGAGEPGVGEVSAPALVEGDSGRFSVPACGGSWGSEVEVCENVGKAAVGDWIS